MIPLDLILLVFFTLLGACVGSFLNVVIYRIPAGESVVSPPSHCPKCNYKLRWFDNIPILSWVFLRARCRKCGTPISFQYPLVELLIAIVFGGFYAIVYLTHTRPSFAGPGIEQTWPVYAVYLVMFAGVFAAVMIDARHFIIPIEVMWLIAALAIVVFPLATLLLPGSVVDVALPVDDAPIYNRIERVEPAVYQHSAEVRLALKDPSRASVTLSAQPRVDGPWISAVLMAALGLVIAWVGMKTGLLPRSFEEEPTDQTPDDDPEAFLAHPHPRREVCKEVLYLLPAVVLGLVGHFVFGGLAVDSPQWLQALGGAAAGYLAGGAVVWVTRIAGTLGFGKEAMGLGDVHLMAAVGAVAGWPVAVLAFFVAPFSGLAYALVGFGLSKVIKREVRMIPYGPHLALAAAAVIVWREPLVEYFAVLFGR